MNNYHVVHKGHGWEIKGANKTEVYSTKKSAVEKGRSLAKEEGKSLIIHSLDGQISRVMTYGNRFAEGRKIKSANVKHRLEGNIVRKSIAKVMSERE